MKAHQRIKAKITHHAGNLVIKSLNQLNLPNSLLIIPDGNRRWAKQMHLPTARGHEAGGDTISMILDFFAELNTKIVGVWGFSEDNWKREKEEIDNIMNVVKHTAETNLAKMQQHEVKFIVIGKKDKIKTDYPEVYRVLENTQKLTANNTKKIFAVFLDYGERWQLEEFAKEREKDSLATTYEILSRINGGLPLFDMVLRTSGELRLSGFGPLASIAEFVVVKKNLPEVDVRDIVLAFKEYSGRKRRLGN
jgi:undecaprenyl diphosphate synthase